MAGSGVVFENGFNYEADPIDRQLRPIGLRVFSGDEIASFQYAIEHGEFPKLANGYSFVTDNRPKNGMTGLIPDMVYASYFSRKLVPIASHGPYRNHDKSHAIGFKVIFENPLLSAVVHSAAIKSSPDQLLSERFAVGLDGLGDTMTILTDARCLFDTGIRDEVGSFVERARTDLQLLINLASGDETATLLGYSPGDLHQTAWQDSGLDKFENFPEFPDFQASPDGIGYYLV